MNKRILSMLLALCMVLSLPCALAEDNLYVPDQVAASIVNGAFDAGKVIGADMKLDLTVNPEQFAADGEGVEILEALTQVLRASTLHVGAAKLSNGLRIELAGTYASPDAAQSESVALALNLTQTGIEAESNLFEGQRVTASWETLLSMLGMSQEDIAQVMALSSASQDELINQLLEALTPVITQAMSLSEPYIAHVMNFVSTLNIETNDNVSAEGMFPAVDHEMSLEITHAQLAELAHALIDTLSQDETLLPMLTSMINSQNGSAQAQVTDEQITVEQVTGEQVIADLNAMADALAHSDGVYSLLIGSSDKDSGLPAYFLLTAQTDALGNGASIFGIVEEGEQENTTRILFNIGQNETDQVTDPFLLDLTMDVTADPNDENVFTMTMDYFVSAEGESVSSVCTIESAAVTTADDLPGYTVTFDMSADLAEGDEQGTMNYQLEGLNSLLPSGGEQSTVSGVINAQVGDEPVEMSIEAVQRIEPTQDGYTGVFSMTESVPQAGFAYTYTANLSSWDYDPAASQALTTIALETATQEEMGALMQQCMDTINQKIATVMPWIPQVLLDSMSFSAEADAEANAEVEAAPVQ